jgi:cation transport regulator ChaC
MVNMIMTDAHDTKSDAHQQWLFAYGTLMHPYSYRRTLGRQVTLRALPASIKGYQRRFAQPYPWWGRIPSVRLALFLERCGALVQEAPDYTVTGVALSVTEHELRLFDRRERVPKVYQRIAVPGYDFVTGEALGIMLWVYVNQAPERLQSRLLPHWTDVAFARRAAYALSDAFGRAYDDTSYLADGWTLLTAVYERAPVMTRRAFQQLTRQAAVQWTDRLEYRIAWVLVIMVYGWLVASWIESV